MALHAKFENKALLPVVSAQLTDQRKLAGDFNDAIYAKLPSIAHAEAKKQAGLIISALDKGVALFADKD